MKTVARATSASSAISAIVTSSKPDSANSRAAACRGPAGVARPAASGSTIGPESNTLDSSPDPERGSRRWRSPPRIKQQNQSGPPFPRPVLPTRFALCRHSRARTERRVSRQSNGAQNRRSERSPSEHHPADELPHGPGRGSWNVRSPTLKSAATRGPAGRTPVMTRDRLIADRLDQAGSHDSVCRLGVVCAPRRNVYLLSIC